MANASVALNGMGFLAPVVGLRRRWSKNPVAIFTYHSVRELPNGAVASDPGVVSATPEVFERQMRWLAEHHRVIGLDELEADLLRGRVPVDCAMVTFDDGYRDNFDVAFPILKRLGLPATFFLATRFISERKVFWWDRISYLLHHTRADRAAISYPCDLTIDLRDRRSAHRLLTAFVKRQHALDVERFLQGLGDALGVRFDRAVETELADALVLTWDQAREMRRHGMTIGSHTHSHRPLPTLPAADLRAELAASKRELEGQLQTDVRAIAYPVGSSLRRMPHILRAAEAAGYTVGFSNVPGSNALADPTARLDLRRMSIDPTITRRTFATMVAFPDVYGMTRLSIRRLRS